MTTVTLVESSGGDDLSDINEAISILQAAGSEQKTLILTGDISVSNMINITSDPGVMIEGVNCTLTQTGSGIRSINFANITSGGCRNIEFIATHYDQNAIYVSGCTNMVFEDLDFTNYARYGIDFSGTCTYSKYYARKESAEGTVALLKNLTAVSGNQFCRTIYSNNADLRALGASKYVLLTSYALFAGGDYSRVDPDTIATYITTYKSGTYPMLIDIEKWDPILTRQEQNLENLKIVTSMYRAGSRHPIGTYRLLPYSDYWTPVKLKRAIGGDPAEDETTETKNLVRNMQLNNHTRDAIGNYVDYLCPKVYVQYDDGADRLEEWKWYATASICEALRCSNGKPVYPIVWFRYQAESGDPELPENIWIEMLKFVATFPGIDGIIAYTPSILNPPTGYTWTDALVDLMAGSGDFVDWV